MNAKPTVVIVPGFNEPDKDLATLSSGRRGRTGLEALGYRCELFPVFADTLSDRIDRYADFIDGLRARGVPFPIVSVGYSLGGLVARGSCGAIRNARARSPIRSRWELRTGA